VSNVCASIGSSRTASGKVSEQRQAAAPEGDGMNHEYVSVDEYGFRKRLSEAGAAPGDDLTAGLAPEGPACFAVAARLRSMPLGGARRAWDGLTGPPPRSALQRRVDQSGCLNSAAAPRSRLRPTKRPDRDAMSSWR
jgi:hypothetical protein